MHCNTTQNSQNVETTQMSIKSWCGISMQSTIQPYKEWEVLMIHAVTWINLEGIMLSERSTDMEVRHCTIPLTINIQNKQIYRESKTSGLSGRGGRGKGNGAWLLKGKGLPLRVIKTLWNWTVITAAYHWECSKCHCIVLIDFKLLIWWILHYRSYDTILMFLRKYCLCIYLLIWPRQVLDFSSCCFTSTYALPCGTQNL